MTHEEAVEAMRDLENSGGEVAHIEADEILIKRLRALGEDELCDLWESIWKWYA